MFILVVSTNSQGCFSRTAGPGLFCFHLKDLQIGLIFFFFNSNVNITHLARCVRESNPSLLLKAWQFKKLQMVSPSWGYISKIIMAQLHCPVTMWVWTFYPLPLKGKIVLGKTYFFLMVLRNFTGKKKYALT